MWTCVRPRVCARDCNSQLPLETQTEQIWFRSMNSSSNAISLLWARLSELVVTDIPLWAGVVQAGRRRPMPETSTRHNRHDPAALRPSR